MRVRTPGWKRGGGGSYVLRTEYGISLAPGCCALMSPGSAESGNISSKANISRTFSGWGDVGTG